MATDYDCFDSQSDLIDFAGFTKFFNMNLIELSKLFEIKAMKKTMTASGVNMTSGEKRDYEEGTYDIADKVTPSLSGVFIYTLSDPPPCHVCLYIP